MKRFLFFLLFLLPLLLLTPTFAQEVSSPILNPERAFLVSTLESGTSTSGSSTYTWNYKNQMTQSGNGVATSTYLYDEQGMRVSMTDAGVTTIYPNKLYNRMGSTGTTTKHLFLPSGLLVSTLESGTSTSGGGSTSTIAFDTVTSNVSISWESGPTTKNWTHTTAGSDRLLVLTGDIFQSVANTGSVTSATYGGVSLTRATSTNASSKACEIWYLANPASGSNTLSVTVTGAHGDLKFSGSSYTGVNQSSPLESIQTARGTDGNPSVSITTTNSGDLLVSTLHRHTTAGATTSRTNLHKDTTGLVLGASSYHIATATGAYADTYTPLVSGHYWCMAMAAFKPSVSSGGGSASTTTRFVTTDHLNGTNLVTDTTGAIVQTLDYYPYGQRRVNSGTDVSRREWIGQEFDESSQLSYLNARYFSSPSGMFLSQDPVARDVAIMPNMAGYILDTNQAVGQYNQTVLLANPQMLNSYSYSVGNPITKSDPSGLATDPGDLVDLASLFTDYVGIGIGKLVGNQQMVAENKEAAKWDTIGLATPAFGLGALNRVSKIPGVKETAYDIAKAGGKHARWMEIYLDKSMKELEKGIKSLDKRIQEHVDKIRNPEKSIPDWNSLPSQKKQNLLEKKWPSDIQRQQEQKNILQGIIDSKKSGK